VHGVQLYFIYILLPLGFIGLIGLAATGYTERKWKSTGLNVICTHIPLSDILPELYIPTDSKTLRHILTTHEFVYSGLFLCYIKYRSYVASDEIWYDSS
jgi:hypothetical protein